MFAKTTGTPNRDEKSYPDKNQISSPTIALPKGGGAIRGIGEKFAANPVTGTGSLSVPIAISPGRSGFGPQLSLSYDSGSGNGPFGFGWSLSLPSITRKTEKGLPRYRDAEESDIFILSGAEDLVPVFKKDRNGNWIKDAKGNLVVDEEGRDGYRVRHYRPRIEGLFARIERWTNVETGETHWRSISKDNITTLYGKSAESRIADPDDSLRVFSWLICESYDDKGDAILYNYVSEDSAGIVVSQAHERNRTDPSRLTNRYLKRINYGNRTPRQSGEDLTLRSDWLFEVVFDYDEGHYEVLPADGERRQFVRAMKDKSRDWSVRQDPFSSYRAGFEVRAYRLCQHVLMFHHFEQELGSRDYLVKSTDFEYRQMPIGSFITTISQAGYRWMSAEGKYIRKSLPPLEFSYTEANVDDTIRTVDAAGLENLPYGLDGLHYQWVDLDSEGLSGILTEQGDGWFYKRNLSALPGEDGNGKVDFAARFAPVELVAAKPSLADLNGGRQQLMDLAGEGPLDLVQFSGPTSGFYKRTGDGHWQAFRTFKTLPNVAWNDPNLKFVDLTGDGHPDILISENEVFTWYLSLAEEGFGTAERVFNERDEERGPALIFADGTQSIYQADLSGDGLHDIVRIRNGEVCYWPNLGYGRFGAKVTMDNAPWFDHPDQFEQKRIRLADIDGSGTTDIIYLGRDGVRLYFNQCGNDWSEPHQLSQFPQTDNVSSVTVVDLLGNGTACLVWSSPLPEHARQPMYYIDLIGGQKPHLMVEMKNNMGAETRVHYAPSTRFYLQDKLNGSPWITRLPFPVHVVERVETYDRISRNRFVTRYVYHHGYFDGIEREFRGFGLVEQWDTEEIGTVTPDSTSSETTNLDQASFVPPVHTKTWFHTGAYLEEGIISLHLAQEYYGAPKKDDPNYESAFKLFLQTLLPNTILPQDLTAEEEREACRALKGSILRQEIYAEDATDKSVHPYTVSERNYTIELLQSQGLNRYVVFFTRARETMDYHYERNPKDPRISHVMMIEVDAFGNVLKSVSTGYGRMESDPALTYLGDLEKQTSMLVTYTENQVTNSIDADDDYRVPLVCEARTYELSGFTPSGQRFSFEDFIIVTAGTVQLRFDNEIAYEKEPTSGRQRRPIEHARTLYRRDDLTDLLPLGQLQSMALPGESYKLAFTPGLLSSVYQRKRENQPTENLLPDLTAVLGGQGGYADLDGNSHWWIPSGRQFYSPNAGDTPAQELAFARNHFFLPHRFQDPFGNNTIVEYDKDPNNVEYNLLVTLTRYALGNEVKAINDYRVLQPELVTDPNGNRSAAAFDALGMVAGTAVMGKSAETLGDSLASFSPDLTAGELDSFFSDPRGRAAGLLKDATTRIVYDLERFKRLGEPPFAATVARETHVNDTLPPGGLRVQVSFSYSDGFGREIQKKIQAEPGPLVAGGPTVNPLWVGSGWTIFNNKGKPVRQYEPFFSPTHQFEFAKAVGVSPILFYDPVERVVATLHPNHTYEKVVFDAWRQETWDVNDTVLQADPKNDPDVSNFFQRLPETDYLPAWHDLRTDPNKALRQWPNFDPQTGTPFPENAEIRKQEKSASDKAAAHANTPTVAHFDTLGRTFLTIADNGAGGKYPTRSELDIEGNLRSVTDALGRKVMSYDYDMLSNKTHQASVDAGERWMLNDVTGKPIRMWDTRGHKILHSYDELHRPTNLFVRQGNGTEVLVEDTVYGESLAENESRSLNLRGKVYQQFDGAGVVTNIQYDFKGNLLSSTRQLLQNYKDQVNWSSAPALESVSFTSSTTYDALNRPVNLTTPDGSIIQHIFNEANLLEQVNVNLRGATTATPFVTNIDYDAKGQRALIEYGNGVTTTYEYDDKTFRLIHLLTSRNNGTESLQDLRYSYDPAGNITHIQDNADVQSTIYFRNQRVEPGVDYLYDAIYRLIEASGREHLGQTGGQLNPPHQVDWDDSFRTNLLHPGDSKAMGNYTEHYTYDKVGNIREMQHSASSGRWTRAYEYEPDSTNADVPRSNRLVHTRPPGEHVGGRTSYTYEANGNMTSMPHLQNMESNFADQLQMVDLGGGGKAYYVYDAAGQRVRKIHEHNGSTMEERIYLGGYEIYRKRTGSGLTLERETLHVMDDKKRIALVETKTYDAGAAIPAPTSLIRNQFDNHLGSACLELDETSAVISYEEYYPYGSTSYQAGRSIAEVSLKRYRYTGKERDEETGLYYHGARYYAPWLGRWTSCDSVAVINEAIFHKYIKHNSHTEGESIESYGRTTELQSLYTYVENNPILFFDPTGMRSQVPWRTLPSPIPRQFTNPAEVYRPGRGPKRDGDDRNPRRGNERYSPNLNPRERSPGDWPGFPSELIRDPDRDKYLASPEHKRWVADQETKVRLFLKVGELSDESRKSGVPLQVQIDTNVLVSLQLERNPLVSYLIKQILDVGGLVFYSPQARREFLDPGKGPQTELDQQELQRRREFLEQAKLRGIFPLEQEVEQSTEFQWGKTLLGQALLNAVPSKTDIKERLGDVLVGAAAIAKQQPLITSDEIFIRPNVQKYIHVIFVPRFDLGGKN
ncbi:MAG: SpvB/TcaC N-terminal domain-containing protein [Ktedonobacteraceae bacterium]